MSLPGWYEELELYSPATGHVRIECTVCKFVVVSQDHSGAAATAYNHVVRQHPDVYERCVGHPPTPERTASTTYALLEGIIPISVIKERTDGC